MACREGKEINTPYYVPSTALDFSNVNFLKFTTTYEVGMTPILQWDIPKDNSHSHPVSNSL